MPLKGSPSGGRLESRFRIFGHRGAPRDFRENTIESLERALAVGADGFETDLRLLADGEPVLYHDGEVAGRPTEEWDLLSLERVVGSVSRVAELSKLNGLGTMILEVKRSGWIGQLLSLIGSWDEVVVSSFDEQVLAEIRSVNQIVELGFIFDRENRSGSSVAARLGVTWIFPHLDCVDAALVGQCHRDGALVVPWTANDAGLWRRFVDLGCDGVITDEPARAVEWRRLLLC